MAELATLTTRQQEIYDFICERIDNRGFPPTIRDIGTAFAIKSPNGVMCHLKALEKKGFINREGKSARAIRPTQRIIPKSGLPFKGLVAVTRGGEATPPAVETLQRLGNVMLLELPIRFRALVSAVQTALRARRRQYEIRDQLIEQQQAREGD